jgi:hypothetical protein
MTDLLRRAAQYGASVQYAEPVTGSSSIPKFGAKKRLTKSDVLEVASQTPYYRADAVRLVGGGFMDSLKSIIGKILPYAMPVAKKYLRESGDIGEKAEKVISALGMGKSGGRMKLADRMM